MIQTAEHIVEPLGFIEADQGIRDTVNHQGYEIISGADIDVLVKRSVTYGVDGLAQTHATHPILGTLYKEGHAWSTDLGDGYYQVHWYPSPTRANEISESIGLVPGEDVLRFVHATTDEIPAPDYVGHYARREYPQSVGPYRFIHDRDNDHAPGVILMPRFLTEMAISEAARALTHPDARMTPLGHKRKYGFLSTQTERLDQVSGYIASVTEVVDREDVIAEYATGEIALAGTRASNLHPIAVNFWQDERRRQERLMERKVRLPELIWQHVLDLLPTIEDLQDAVHVP